MGVKTIWELCLFQVAPFVSFQGLQMGIFVFWTERDWSRKSCYGNTIEGVIDSFQPLDFDGLLQPLLITWCYNHGIRMKDSWAEKKKWNN